MVLSTIFPSRFHESSQLLKQAIDQQRFGRLTVGDAYVKWYRTQQYYDSGAWRGTWKLDGGGALMNQAIHSVDLLSWLMGPVKDLSARTAMLAHERIEVEDVAVATLRFANGALGVIEATTAAYPGALKRIEIHGSDGLGRAAGRRYHDLEFRPTRRAPMRPCSNAWPAKPRPAAAPQIPRPSATTDTPPSSRTCCRPSRPAAHRSSTAPKAAAPSRSFWPSTKRPSRDAP